MQGFDDDFFSEDDQGGASYERRSYNNQQRAPRYRQDGPAYAGQSARPAGRNAAGRGYAQNQDAYDYPQDQRGYRQPQRGPVQDQRAYAPSQRAHAQDPYAREQRGQGPRRMASHARVPQPQPRKKSPIPVILLALVVVGVLAGAFFFITSLGRNSSSTSNGGASTEHTATITEGSAQAAPQQPASVTINTLMVGDMLVHHGVWESGEYSTTERNYDHLFAHVLDDLSWADLAMIDQETPLVGPTAFDFSGFPSFNGPLEIADAEAKAGFNMILHASNHAMDQGSNGLRTELTYWRSNHPDVQVVGAYMPQEEVAANMGPRYFEKDGFKVAVLNYTYDLNGYEDPYDAVCEIDVAQMEKDVAIAEANADLTIVCPHWGVEDETSPNDEQLELAKLMCDWGVDLVFGNHPHVIQPVQLVVNSAGHTMPVYWSTGNFISTMDQDRNLIGGIAKAVLVKDANGARVSEATFTPIVAHRAPTISSNGINDESSEPSYNADLTTYKLFDYTDALAETNAWRAEDSRPSHAWCVDFCSEVLGSAFDRTSCIFTLSLDPTTGRNLGGTSSTSTSTGSSSDSSMTMVDGGANQTEQLAA